MIESNQLIAIPQRLSAVRPDWASLRGTRSLPLLPLAATPHSSPPSRAEPVLRQSCPCRSTISSLVCLVHSYPSLGTCLNANFLNSIPFYRVDLCSLYILNCSSEDPSITQRPYCIIIVRMGILTT